jgi:hypothetical protein
MGSAGLEKEKRIVVAVIGGVGSSFAAYFFHTAAHPYPSL